MSTLKKPRFHVSVNALPNGGGYSTTRDGVSACIAEGLNHARFLLADHPGRTHTHALVRVEALCATCDGLGSVRGKRGLRNCPDCKGGSVTSPISGPTAVVLTVTAGGAVYEGTGPIAKPCECDGRFSLREGAPGEVCRRCARPIPTDTPRKEAP